MLDEIFSTEVGKRVVTNIARCLKIELKGAAHTNTPARMQVRSTASHSVSSAVCSNINVQGSKIGLCKQELTQAGR